MTRAVANKFCPSCLLQGEKVELFHCSLFSRCPRCDKDIVSDRQPKAESPSVVKGLKAILH